MYIYMDIQTRMHKHTYTHTNMHHKTKHMHTFTHIHARITRKYIHTYIHTHIHTYIHSCGRTEGSFAWRVQSCLVGTASQWTLNCTKQLGRFWPTAVVNVLSNSTMCDISCVLGLPTGVPEQVCINFKCEQFRGCACSGCTGIIKEQ